MRSCAECGSSETLGKVVACDVPRAGEGNALWKIEVLVPEGWSMIAMSPLGQAEQQVAMWKCATRIVRVQEKDRIEAKRRCTSVKGRFPRRIAKVVGIWIWCPLSPPRRMECENKRCVGKEVDSKTILLVTGGLTTDVSKIH